MAKKAFFQESTIPQVRALNLSQAYSQRNLVQLINNLNPTEDGLLIRAQIIPGKHFRGGLTGAEASRKCYKHGNLIRLPQPQSLAEAYDWDDIPLDLRSIAFSDLEKMKQQEINFVGYSFRPVFGNDRTKRIVPFVNLPEGARLFTYAENISKFMQKNKHSGKSIEKHGIKVEEYPDARRVRKEGSNVIVEVPSRSVRQSKYKFGLSHVPYLPHNPQMKENFNLATVLSLGPSMIRDAESPVRGQTPHQLYDIQYKYSDSREQSQVIRFSPQEIAGYLGIIKKQLSEDQNITALTFNPFAIPSSHQASFYNKLENNVVIFDPSLNNKSNKTQLRKLHLAEKSILLARAIGHFGHNDFAYWDPTRDGLLKDYDWKK